MIQNPKFPNTNPNLLDLKKTKRKERKGKKITFVSSVCLAVPETVGYGLDVGVVSS